MAEGDRKKQEVKIQDASISQPKGGGSSSGPIPNTRDQPGSGSSSGSDTASTSSSKPTSGGGATGGAGGNKSPAGGEPAAPGGTTPSSPAANQAPESNSAPTGRPSQSSGGGASRQRPRVPQGRRGGSSPGANSPGSPNSQAEGGENKIVDRLKSRRGWNPKGTSKAKPAGVGPGAKAAAGAGSKKAAAGKAVAGKTPVGAAALWAGDKKKKKKEKKENKKTKKEEKAGKKTEKGSSHDNKKTKKDGGSGTPTGASGIQKKGLRALIYLLIILFLFIVVVVIGLISTGLNLFSSGKVVEGLGRYNHSNAVEYVLDVHLVYHINKDNPDEDQWNYTGEGHISPLSQMMGYWEEVGLREKFIVHVSDRFNLDPDYFREKPGDIIDINAAAIVSTRENGFISVFAPDNKYQPPNLTMDAKTLNDEFITFETDEVMNIIQFYRSSFTPTTLITRYFRNRTMLRELGISDRSILEINDVREPVYNEDDPDEDKEIVEEEYIAVTSQFLERFENYTFRAAEAAIACVYASPVEHADITKDATDPYEKRDYQYECEKQFDARLSDTDKDHPTGDILQGSDGKKEELIQMSFDLKFNDGDGDGEPDYNPQEKYLELAKVEREYVDEVLTSAYMKAIQNYLVYWKDYRGTDLKAAVESAKGNGSLEQANFMYTYQTYMLYNDTISTAIHETNRSGSNNTEKRISDYYLGDFSSSRLWKLYEDPDALIQPKEGELVPVCLNDSWEPENTLLTEIVDEVTGSYEQICPERKFYSSSQQLPEPPSSVNSTMRQKVKELFPEDPFRDEDGNVVTSGGEQDIGYWEAEDEEGAYDLATHLLDSNITPLNSGPQAYDSFLAGEFALDYVLNSSRSSSLTPGERVRDEGSGGSPIDIEDARSSALEEAQDAFFIDDEQLDEIADEIPVEQSHRLKLAYKVFDLQAWGYGENPFFYYALYPGDNDLDVLWATSCGAHETKKSFNKWAIPEGLSTHGDEFYDFQRSDVCSLIQAVSSVGSFRYNDETTHKMKITERLNFDKPHRGAEEFDREANSTSDTLYGDSKRLEFQCVDVLNDEGELIFDGELPANWTYRPSFRSDYDSRLLNEFYGSSEIPAASSESDLGVPLTTITHEGTEITIQPKAVPPLQDILKNAKYAEQISVLASHRDVCDNARLNGDPTQHAQQSKHLSGLAVVVTMSSPDGLAGLVKWINESIPGVYAESCGEDCIDHNARITFEASEFREPLESQPIVTSDDEDEPDDSGGPS